MGVSLSGIEPLAPGASQNVFEYSLNDPVNKFDPHGQGLRGFAICVAAEAANFISANSEIEKLSEQIERLDRDREQPEEICFPDEATKQEFLVEIEKERLRVPA